MIKIDLIAAARPNFMKIAPLHHRLAKEPWAQVRLVHTGQHYDANMSELFFRDLGIPSPDANLGVGSGTHAEQTGGVMIAYEKLCIESRPDWCIVVGDVNSTIACTLAASKLGIRVAHLEAGLRSRDRGMPEEINRIATDALADLLWTPSPDADQNLRDEGVAAAKIDCIGNIMIDSFELMRASIERRQFAAELGLTPGRFGVVTLHRPSNVDDPAQLRQLAAALERVSGMLPLAFPLHPRTRGRLDSLGMLKTLLNNPRIRILDPQGYIDFMSLVTQSALVVTDSGGVQEETTYLHIPCLTLRENTERPITVMQGTNRLINADGLTACIEEVLAGRWQRGTVPALWDGQTARRAAASLKRVCGV